MSAGLRVGALALLGLLIVVVRVVVSSRAELRLGEAAESAGERDEALLHLGQAARLDAPENPWSARALARLEELAEGAEGRGEAAAALDAWREVRHSLLATRGLWQRRPELRRRADGRIAALSAALESPAVDPGSDEPGRARWHAARLAEDDAPSPGWSLLALAGLLSFLGCAAGLIGRGLDARLRFRPTAVGWSIGLGLGFALFLISLARA